MHQQRRRVRALVHRAWFEGDPVERYHIKVTNTSPRREIEITHIWFETDPRVDVVNPETPLPQRLRLDETFETWIPAALVPSVPDIERRVRVLLSNGKVVKSRLNKNVPPVGAVARPGRR